LDYKAYEGVISVLRFGVWGLGLEAGEIGFGTGGSGYRVSSLGSWGLGVDG
jgi:hypothetical protein